MYFKRIDIQGFKSFAEPVSIEFHEGITCIVGPNGSGKSNISDAIRWVLGEQSAKILRGGKMEEVIFAGTANRKSRGMAEVTLTIDNSRQLLPIDYSEVAITRRMYRSGESGYFINKVACRLRDIRELIMDTGIGVDGYSIIGQGRIADILSDKPESRREIFEEAAGIVKYRSKKEESERKLESSQANLDRVNDIVGEIESRIDGLREDSVKASEYIELRDRCKDIEINITLKNIENLELKNEYIKDDISETGVLIEKTSGEKRAIDRDAGESQRRSEELEVKNDQGKARLLELVGEINSLSSETQLTLERFSTMDRDRVRIEGEITSILEKKKKEEKNIEDIRTKLLELDKENELIQVSLQRSSLNVESLERDIDGIQKEIDSCKGNIFEGQRKMMEKRSEAKSLLSLKENLIKREAQLIEEERDREKTIIDLEQSFKSLTDEKNDAESSLVQLKKRTDKLKFEYDDYASQQENLSRQLDEKRMLKGQLEARHRLINEMEAAYEGYNEPVKYIMKSSLTGMHGVVADLIRVPKGFEKAIETALGMSLQNIVCDGNDDARRAIGLLKEKRVGRLTFLPLSSIRAYAKLAPKGFSAIDGYKGLAVDCIEFQGKYKAVMDYLLGRVIIVNTLKDAIDMSKHQGARGFRFVSLEGDVVNSSGAITGGAYRTKTLGLLERKVEAKTLTARLLKLEEEEKLLVEDLKKLTGAAEACRVDIENLSREEKNVEINLLKKASELARLELEIENIDEEGKRRFRELRTIESEGKSADSMIHDLEKEIQEDQISIDSEENKVKEAVEKRIVKEEKLENAREELTNIRLLAGKANNAKTNEEQAVKRTIGYIEEYSHEIESRKKALEGIEKEKANLTIDDRDRGEVLITKEKDRVALESQLERIGQERVALAAYLKEIREKRESVDDILAGLQRDKHELELKLTKNETLVEGYKEKLWEDFEVSYIQAMDFQKSNFVMSTAVKESRKIRNRMKELGEVNLGSIKEYEKVKERYEFLTGQRDDLLEAMNSLRQIIDDMDRNIRRSFLESYKQVVVNFEKTFTSLFGGGSAELRLVDESRPLETGIDIIVQPPGKKLQNISLLSGGEKTLTAIALMFAILKTKPTPFCILDEVEASLDEANIDRFANYLRDFKEIQFTLVTHQKATMEYADVLYGVTMPEGGISKVISLKLGDEFEL